MNLSSILSALCGCGTAVLKTDSAVVSDELNKSVDKQSKNIFKRYSETIKPSTDLKKNKISSPSPEFTKAMKELRSSSDPVVFAEKLQSYKINNPYEFLSIFKQLFKHCRYTNKREEEVIFHISPLIESFENSKWLQYKIAKHCIRSIIYLNNNSIIEMLKIKDDKLKFELLKIKFLEIGYQVNFDPENEDSCIEAARSIIEIGNRGLVVCLFANMAILKIKNQKALFELALLASKRHALSLSEYFKNFNIISEESRIHIAKEIMRREDFLFRNFENFNIENDQETLIYFAKFLLEKDPVRLFGWLHKFKIKSKEIRFEIVKNIINKVNDLTLLDFSAFPLCNLDLQHRLELFKIIIKKDLTLFYRINIFINADDLESGHIRTEVIELMDQHIKIFVPYGILEVAGLLNLLKLNSEETFNKFSTSSLVWFISKIRYSFGESQTSLINFAKVAAKREPYKLIERLVDLSRDNHFLIAEILLENDLSDKELTLLFRQLFPVDFMNLLKRLSKQELVNFFKKYIKMMMSKAPDPLLANLSADKNSGPLTTQKETRLVCYKEIRDKIVKLENEELKHELLFLVTFYKLFADFFDLKEDFEVIKQIIEMHLPALHFPLLVKLLTYQIPESSEPDSKLLHEKMLNLRNKLLRIEDGEKGNGSGDKLAAKVKSGKIGALHLFRLLLLPLDVYPDRHQDSNLDGAKAPRSNDLKMVIKKLTSKKIRDDAEKQKKNDKSSLCD